VTGRPLAPGTLAPSLAPRFAPSGPIATKVSALPAPGGHCWSPQTTLPAAPARRPLGGANSWVMQQAPPTQRLVFRPGTWSPLRCRKVTCTTSLTTTKQPLWRHLNLVESWHLDNPSSPVRGRAHLFPGPGRAVARRIAEPVSTQARHAISPVGLALPQSSAAAKPTTTEPEQRCRFHLRPRETSAILPTPLSAALRPPPPEIHLGHTQS